MRSIWCARINRLILKLSLPLKVSLNESNNVILTSYTVFFFWDILCVKKAPDLERIFIKFSNSFSGKIPSSGLNPIPS